MWLASASSPESTRAQSAARSEPVRLEITYTGDVFANVSGGISTGVDYLGDLSALLTVDMESALGWDGGRLFAYSLLNHGAEPSERVGDIQVADNIEAPDTWKLYELWYQQNLFRDRLSVLAGLYDLNSEFDVIPAAGLFLNSSFGIGAEYAASGRNGPSIFPTTSLGVRAAVKPVPEATLRVAALDGVPGDPDDPYGTDVRLSSEEGALLALEASLIRGDGEEAETQHRVGRGKERAPYRTRMALGAWYYTASFEVQNPATEPASRQKGNLGLYASVEHQLSTDPTHPERGLTLFTRAGWAEPDVNRLVAYIGAGLVYHGPLRGRPADRAGIGVAIAVNGSPFKDARRAEGRRVDPVEAVLEATYRLEVVDRLSVQPDIQYVINPGTDVTLPDALAMVLRFELSI